MPDTRVLVLSTDPVSDRMPGPAIRAWHLAEVLSGSCQVTLASTVACDRRHPGFATRAVAFDELDELGAHTDAVVCPAGVLHFWPGLAEADLPVAFDVYDPYHLENLASAGPAGAAQRDEHLRLINEGINAHLRRGDFFVCASERQRDFWLGSLTALGRVNAATYGAGADLRGLIDVVPFGISRRPPRRDGGALRRRFPAVDADDPVVIWAGGLYDWFDPLTLVRAVGLLRARRPRVHLVFLGAGHPNPAIPPMPVAVQTRELSERLGLSGDAVIFNDSWVPYDDRDLWLTDADVGVSTHLDHAETRYSFRTRVLDYLWADLPTVLSAGDVLSEDLGAAGVGMSVVPGDEEALAGALDAALDLRPRPEQFAAVRDRLYWDVVTEPLVRFCQTPRRAADAAAATLPAPAPPAPPAEAPPPAPPDSGILRRWSAGRLGRR